MSNTFDVDDDTLEKRHVASKAMLRALKDLQDYPGLTDFWREVVDEAVEQAEKAGITTGEDQHD